MKESQRVGKVLWWSERDQNGILLDPKGNEYYFDSSVLSLRKGQRIKADEMVVFLPGKADGILAAKEVSLPLARQKSKVARTFELSKHQLSLPLRF
jgi:hypothetical protein